MCCHTVVAVHSQYPVTRVSVRCSGRGKPTKRAFSLTKHTFCGVDTKTRPRAHSHYCNKIEQEHRTCPLNDIHSRLSTSSTLQRSCLLQPFLCLAQVGRLHQFPVSRRSILELEVFQKKIQGISNPLFERTYKAFKALVSPRHL